jgi:hypothetical protein
LSLSRVTQKVVDGVTRLTFPPDVPPPPAPGSSTTTPPVPSTPTPTTPATGSPTAPPEPSSQVSPVTTGKFTFLASQTRSGHIFQMFQLLEP